MSKSQAQKETHQFQFDDDNYIRILLDFINQSLLALLPTSLFDQSQKLTRKDMDQLLPEQCKSIVSLMFRGKAASDLREALSSPSSRNKIQRVSDLITEYDKDRCRSPNPGLHAFVQKLKVIVNEETEVSRNDARNYGNPENKNSAVSSSATSSFGSSPQIGVGASDTNQKVIVEALGNHVVLREIFKCGSFHDLKNFRLVNKQWNGIGNSAIIQRRLWKLNVKDFRCRSGCDASGNDEVVLVKLNDCIEASGGSFPLTTLDFSDVGPYTSLKSAALNRFYDLMGCSIKRVVFNNFSLLNMDEFQDLLVNKMPNVDHIDAGNIVFTNEIQCRRLPITVLPSLKTIRFIGNESYLPCNVLPYYKIILLAAINLKEIQDFHFELTDIVSETKKMGCIQELKLDFGLEESEANYVKFSHTIQPKLITSISIHGRVFEDFEFKLSPVLAGSLKRILNSCKDTLKRLHCRSRIFPADFELPEFPNLEFLSVTVLDESEIDETSDSYYHSAIVFPRRCDCSVIFPKVDTVLLRLRSTFKTLHDYFPGQAFQSVTTLEFQRNYQFGIGNLFKMVFPNVSHIKISDYKYVIEDAYEYPGNSNRGFHSDLGNQIESLEFNQCMLACAWTPFQLDSLFTGVPRRRCTRLLEMYHKRKAKGEDEDIRIVRNILEAAQTRHGNRMFRNSEGLRRIKISFNHKDNVNFRIPQTSHDSDLDTSSDYICECDQCPEYSEDEDNDVKTPRPVMTPVSCAYGFSLMPNLEQVIFGYDHTLPNASDIAQFFKPFAEFPYVKIVHEPTDWNDYFQLSL